MNTLRSSLRATLLAFGLLGLVWPLTVTALAQVIFPVQAGGSLIQGPQGPRGSRLLGQSFSFPHYLSGRPSAAGYDPTASAASNLGPTNPALKLRREAEALRLQNLCPEAGPVPEVLLSSSGSGLDPHLSPEAARWQAPCIARARKVAPERVLALVEEQTEHPFLGDPVVPVLAFNLALDLRFPLAATP